MKLMLSTDELIDHMKSKGISFNITTEAEAKEFLEKHNYYLKLSAYRCNYEKNDSGPNIYQYKKLDFAYLKELSTLDMHLRYIVMEMCLDIEHAIKVKLLSTIASDPNEDGYNVVKCFLAEDTHFRVLKSINSHNKSEYCRDLIKKYYPYFPVWVFVEVISFGDLLCFCSYYSEKYNVKIVNNKLMNIVRDMRNAAAHSNCLINKMLDRLDPTKQPHSEITEFVKNVSSISRKRRAKNLNYNFTYNFTTLLYIYDSLMPDISKKHTYKKLQDFLNNRVCKNKEYFNGNNKIVGVYKFIKELVDSLVATEYNG